MRHFLSIILVLVLVCFQSAFSCSGPDHTAFETFVAQNGLQNIITVTLPVISSVIKGQSIPDDSGEQDKISYTISNIQVVDITVGNGQVNFANNALTVSLSGLSLHLTLDWKYELSVFPHLPRGSGSADVYVSGNTISLTVASNNDCAIPVSVSAVNVVLDQIKVDVHGSILSWLYDIVFKLAQSRIRSTVEKMVTTAITTQAQIEISHAMSSLPFHQHILDLDIDLSFAQPPLVNVSTDQPHLVLFNQAEITTQQVNTTFAVCDVTRVPHPGMPTDLFTGKMIQIAVNEFVFNAAFCSLHNSGKLHVVLDDSMLPPDSPFHLRTDAFALIIPQLQDQFPNSPLRLTINSAFAPNLTIVGQAGGFLGVSLSVDNQVFFNNEWQEAFTIQVDLWAGFVPSLSGNVFSAQAEYEKSNIFLTSSNIGQFDVVGLENIINYLLPNVLLPMLNKKLAEGIVLPIPSTISLSGDTIILIDGNFVVASDFTFNPNQKSEKLRATVTACAQDDSACVRLH